MKTITRTVKIYCLLFVLLSCSNNNKKEEAEKYFDLVQQTVQPFVTSTHKMVEETMPIARRFHSSGRKLDSEDSLKLLNALIDFNKNSEETLKQFNDLRTFEEYDLKKPTSEWVTRVTKLVKAAFSEALTHSYSKNRTEEQMTKIKDDFVKEYIKATEDYSQVQDEFKKKFGIE